MPAMGLYLFAFLLIGVVLGEDLKDYHDSNLHFASDVYAQYSKEHKGNFLICPFSAQTVMALLTVGAKETTARELSTVLRLPSETSRIEEIYQSISSDLEINKEYQLTTANKIYVRKGVQLKNDYKAIAQNTFKSDIENINFDDKIEATKEINKWVESKTNNKIKDLLNEDTIHADTMALIINTLYFHGEWVHKFGKPFPMKFYTTETEFADVDMMTQRHHFNYYHNKDIQAEFLELPFVGEDVVMTFVLPKQRFGLADLEKSISSVLEVQPYTSMDAVISIPKFQMESEINFKTLLKSLGAVEPFTSKADYRGITDIPLVVDEIVQKTFIEIGEIGATAASSTRLSAMAVSMPRVNFHANHPFIYYLRHKIHGVFFVGRYTKP